MNGKPPWLYTYRVLNWKHHAPNERVLPILSKFCNWQRKLLIYSRMEGKLFLKCGALLNRKFVNGNSLPSDTTKNGNPYEIHCFGETKFEIDSAIWTWFIKQRRFYIFINICCAWMARPISIYNYCCRFKFYRCRLSNHD